MAKRHILLCTTVLAGLGLSGLVPAGAQKPSTPNISVPNISPARPDFSPRTGRDVATPDRSIRVPSQVLAMTDGTRINAVFDRTSNTFKVALKDGTYKLNNGGAIRVRGGKIVWDAFGVIERLKTNPAEFPPALG